jgi:hypothetical protein
MVQQISHVRLIIDDKERCDPGVGIDLLLIQWRQRLF